jgi:hypothetical protein
VVLAEHPAVPAEGVIIQLPGLLVLTRPPQVDGVVGGRACRGGPRRAPGGTG